METKIEIIDSSPRLSDLLTPDPVAVRSHGSIVLATNEYAGIGCDLRDINTLDAALKSCTKLLGEDCLVLCVAEVSITYMNLAAADALIKWALTISPGEYFDTLRTDAGQEDMANCQVRCNVLSP